MPTSLGPMEILVIMVVALIVLGPERLPKAARQIGKAVAELRQWSGGIQDEVRNAFNTDVEPDQSATAPPGAATPVVFESPDPMTPSPADGPISDTSASGLPASRGPAPSDPTLPAPGFPDGPSPN